MGITLEHDPIRMRSRGYKRVELFTYTYENLLPIIIKNVSRYLYLYLNFIKFNEHNVEAISKCGFTLMHAFIPDAGYEIALFNLKIT